jgi:hypothetical protein
MSAQVMCGKNRDTMDTCISRARGGGQIILLKHTGFWCDQMALGVEDASLRGMPGHKHRSCLRVPANVMDYFLDFDVLKHSASHVADCVEINQCVGCTRQFFTKSFLGDDAAVPAPSSGKEPASPRHRAGVASMALRTTR